MSGTCSGHSLKLTLHRSLLKQLDHRDLYVTPPFPSLTISSTLATEGPSLRDIKDIWRFTLLWTLIVFGVFHLAACFYALAVQHRNWKVISFVTLGYLVVAGIEAVISGSIVGLIIGAVYNAGSFRMSTWIPFIWSLINVLILILSSFSIQGAL